LQGNGDRREGVVTAGRARGALPREQLLLEVIGERRAFADELGDLGLG
jgi:hypothetical protein